MRHLTERLRLHARQPAGVASATFSFERDVGEVLGHAVLRQRPGGRDAWHVTDRDAPPFVVEEFGQAPTRGWLVTRPDGIPFATITSTGDASLDLVVRDCERTLVRCDATGALRSASDRSLLGRLELSDPTGRGDAVLELPRGGDLTLRAALLALPLCVSRTSHLLVLPEARTLSRPLPRRTDGR